MKARVAAVLAAGLWCAVVACNEITYPAPTEPTPSIGPLPTNILLSATPDRLPISGGTSTVAIRVVASGGVGIGAANVKVSSTEGELDASEVATDDNGNASVRWTTTKTGSVVARLGSIVASVTIPVQDVLPPPPPVPPGPPGPPTPTPPGEPVLLVDIFASGDLDVLSNIHFAGAAKLSTTNEGVPIAAFAWDFESDGTIDSRAAAPAHTYVRGGEYTVTLDVTAADGRRGRGTRPMAIGSAPPPLVAVSLVANPATVVTGQNVTLTATATPTKTAGTVTAYEWDFDGNGSVDATTPTSSTTTSYSTTGTRSPSVTARTSTGHRGSASTSVTVNTQPPPPLVATLTADATTVVAGTTVTFTTTITGLAPGETLGQIRWDWDGNATVDDIRSGAVGAPLSFTYAKSGFYDATVTADTSTGRTVSATRRITVTTP